MGVWMYGCVGEGVLGAWYLRFRGDEKLTVVGVASPQVGLLGLESGLELGLGLGSGLGFTNTINQLA